MMEKMETTIVDWGYTVEKSRVVYWIMEKKMETTLAYWGYIVT